jgi:hypothetical protein
VSVLQQGDGREYRLEYGLVSATCSSLHLVATSDRASCSQFQFVAICCSGSAGTLNPKVEGSSPSRPTHEVRAQAGTESSYRCTTTQGIQAAGGGTMNPTCVPFGTTSRHRPGRGRRTTARQFLGLVRFSVISNPSCGTLARAITESPVTVPTTSYQSLPGATAISRSQSFFGTTKPVWTARTNRCPTAGVRSLIPDRDRAFRGRGWHSDACKAHDDGDGDDPHTSITSGGSHAFHARRPRTPATGPAAAGACRCRCEDVLARDRE